MYMTRQEFEHIAAQLRQKVLNVSTQFFASRQDAEDAAQEAMVQLWRYCEQIDASRNIDALAVRVAKNCCVSMYRRQQHTADIDQQTLKNVIGYQLRCMRYAAELQRKLRERIPEEGKSGSGGLPPETLYRGTVSDEDLRLLIWFYLEDWSQKELAEELGISLNACKKRIQRAKERLRSALEETEDPEGGSPERRERE